MKIYLVEGETGEYDDRHSWISKAFKSKESADKFASHLDLNITRDSMNGEWYDLRNEIEAKGKLIDPSFHCDYTGTSYCVIEMELEE